MKHTGIGIILFYQVLMTGERDTIIMRRRHTLLRELGECITRYI